MTQAVDKSQKAEMERIVDLERMGPGGAALEITPTDAERGALIKRFGFLGLPVFSARVTVDQRPGGQIVVEGRLRGKIVQACILTLESVTQELDEPFRIIFKPDLAEESDPDSGEAMLNANADAPEPLPGNLLDVGEIVAEQLALAADPYPRRPGAKLEDVLPKPTSGRRPGREEARRHPFAGLAALKDKPRGRR